MLKFLIILIFCVIPILASLVGIIGVTILTLRNLDLYKRAYRKHYLGDINDK